MTAPTDIPALRALLADVQALVAAAEASPDDDALGHEASRRLRLARIAAYDALPALLEREALLAGLLQEARDGVLWALTRGLEYIDLRARIDAALEAPDDAER